MLGSRVPVALKIFLMALAIIDDLGAIVIIALFYTSDLSVLSLSVAAVAIAVLALLNVFNVRRTGIYILVGMVLWTAVLKSGVHATLAGVIVGFFIPLKEQDGKSPARQLEHVLHPWVGFMILPLFAFANAGVSGRVTPDGLTSVLPLGIIAGLFIGKPLGISLFCWLALKLKLASLPNGTTFSQIMAVGVLCGIDSPCRSLSRRWRLAQARLSLSSGRNSAFLSGRSAAVMGYTLLKVKLSGQAVHNRKPGEGKPSPDKLSGSENVMSHLNYNHLYYFWHVYKQGSVVGAAEALYLTPQTITGQIKARKSACRESF